jgi:hypothetical protein
LPFGHEPPAKVLILEQAAAGEAIPVGVHLSH